MKSHYTKFTIKQGANDVRNNRKLLLNLLVKRNEDYFFDMSFGYMDDRKFQINEDKNGDNSSALSNESIIFVSNKIIKIDKIKTTSDEILKYLFASLLGDVSLNLDIDKCRKMKAGIEAEIEREKANDLYEDL